MKFPIQVLTIFLFILAWGATADAGDEKAKAVDVPAKYDPSFEGNVGIEHQPCNEDRCRPRCEVVEIAPGWLPDECTRIMQLTRLFGVVVDGAIDPTMFGISECRVMNRATEKLGCLFPVGWRCEALPPCENP